MNLVAMIGIIEKITPSDKMTEITLKVEKPFFDSKGYEDYFEVINVYISNHLFSQEVKRLTNGSLIGFKGRVKTDEGLLKIIVEKIQVF